MDFRQEKKGGLMLLVNPPLMMHSRNTARRFARFALQQEFSAVKEWFKNRSPSQNNDLRFCTKMQSDAQINDYM